MPLRILSPIRKARARGRGGRPAQARLEQLQVQFSRVFSADLQKGISTFGERVDYGKMANAVYSGKWDKVYATLPTQFLPGDIEASMKRLGISIEQASKIAAEQIPFGRGTDASALTLPANNPKVDEFLDVRSGALITNIEDNMQVNVQSALRAGLDNKETAEQIADRIRTSGIGLNYRQSQAMITFEAARRAEGLNGQALADRLDEQAARYLQQRCDMIARTEVSGAQNFAQQEVWSAAQADGLIPDTAQKIWVVDGNPCPMCLELQGEGVGLDEQFETSDGELIDGPPAHVNCLCSLSLG